MTASRKPSFRPGCEALDDRRLPSAVVPSLAHPRHAAAHHAQAAHHRAVVHHHPRVTPVIQPAVFVGHHRFADGFFGPAYFFPDGFFHGGAFYGAGYYDPGFIGGDCGCSGPAFDPGAFGDLGGGFDPGFGDFGGGFDGGRF